MNYYIDPVRGDDSFSGQSESEPWQSFARVNMVVLGPGDRVVIAPGKFENSLVPKASGTVENPVQIEFLPGVHRFEPAHATRVSYFISNATVSPHEPRPVAMLVKDCRHLQIIGQARCEWLLGGRMMYLVNDHSECIAYRGLTFDMARPTVSEFRVIQAKHNSATIRIAEGSTFAIEAGRFRWTGDIGSGRPMAQQVDLATRDCRRRGDWDPFAEATARDLGDSCVALEYPCGTYDMDEGKQYQFRLCKRDNSSAFNNRCQNISFKDCHFYTFPGMGVISQFTDNITFKSVHCAPRPGTIRTCAAWADCFQFSGCRGQVIVDSCRFSGTQDDPINVHGTYLRIIRKMDRRKILVSFAHPQTYGFRAFASGDQVAFVNHKTLRPYATNMIESVERQTDHDWRLTLRDPVATFAESDVIDNVSWYPNVTIRDCEVDTDSTRGFLITTRGKTVVENCIFHRTKMSAILVENDAEGWFESGAIRDLAIRGNRFVNCGNPVVFINPRYDTTNATEPVHENIRIENNTFDGGGIKARSVKGLTVTNNQFANDTLPVEHVDCEDVIIQNNASGLS